MEVITMTIFEKIVAREIPGHIVYEDDLVLAFLDISEVSKGHTLVIPKKAYPDLLSMPDDLLSYLMIIAKKIAVALNDVFKPLGFNIINNNGSIAGQTVFHFHLHIIPRYDAKEFSYQIPKKETTANLKAVATLIKAALS